MPKKSKIPDGWMDYSALGERVEGTSFLPFKVPLKEEILRRNAGVLDKQEWFTPDTLLQKVPNLKLIIDLTNTDKYYNAEDVTRRGVSHKKINCFGRGWLPPARMIRTFCNMVDNFVRQYGTDYLIGVHCTHGLNRTGYFICKYMVTKMGILPQEAIDNFQNARGHTMNRLPLINDILQESAPVSMSRAINCNDQVKKDNRENVDLFGDSQFNNVSSGFRGNRGYQNHRSHQQNYDLKARDKRPIRTPFQSSYSRGISPRYSNYRERNSKSSRDSANWRSECVGQQNFTEDAQYKSPLDGYYEEQPSSSGSYYSKYNYSRSNKRY